MTNRVRQLFALGLNSRRGHIQFIDNFHRAGKISRFSFPDRSRPANRALVGAAARTFDAAFPVDRAGRALLADPRRGKEFRWFRANPSRVNWSTHHRSVAKSAGFSVPDRESISFH